MNIQDEVVEFIAEYTGVCSSKITPSTLINDELGVDGEDGIELLREFSDKFEVDITSVNETYFGPEGFPLSIFIWPFLLILNKLGWEQKIFNDITPLPVDRLIESAKINKWVVWK